MRTLIILTLTIMLVSCGDTKIFHNPSPQERLKQLEVCYQGVVYFYGRRTLSVKFNNDGSVATCTNKT